MYILSQEAFVQGTIAGEFALLEFTGHNLQWHALAVHGQEVEGRTVWMGPVAFLCCNVSPASPPPTSIGIWTQKMQSHKYQNTWRTLSPRGRPPPSVPRPTAGHVDEVACWESGRWGLAFIPGVYADQSPGDSGIRASWSCQPYIRCCSQRSLYGCSWWTPGYPTERRLWVGWLWAEAWKYQAGFYGSKVPGAQVGHSMAGVGLQVPAQQHTAAHELVVSSHFFSRWGTCHWISLGHGRRWCMCLVQNLAAS